MKLIPQHDLSGNYGILNIHFKNGYYQLNDNNYLFIIDFLFIKLSREEFNSISKYYKIYTYNCYNYNMFILERFKLNYEYIKKCYKKFTFDRSNDIFNIKEFKRLIDILYNINDFSKLLFDIIWENNISRTVEAYILEQLNYEHTSN